MNQELRKETLADFIKDVVKRSWRGFSRPLFAKLGFVSKLVFRTSNLSLNIYDRFAAKIFRPFSKYFIFNTVYRRRLVGLVGLVIIVSLVYLQTLTQIKPPDKLQLTDLPYQEKITEGAWALKNREPIQQVLAEGAKADLNLKEVKMQSLKISDAKVDSKIDYDTLKYRWFVTLMSGTKFEFGGVSADTPKDKVLPIVKITNKEGWFVRYAPKEFKSENQKFVSPKVKGNTVEWEISDGITARYTMMQDRVKADYVINNKSNLISNKLEFDVVSGQIDPKSLIINPKSSLKGELMPGGDIEWFSELVDSGGQTATQFTFPAPLVKEAGSKSHKSRINSEYEFDKVATGQYSLAVVLDKKDLEKATFPLTIDPVVIDAAVPATGTAYGNSRMLLRDSWGNLVAFVNKNTGDSTTLVYFKAYSSSTWTDAGLNLDGSTADTNPSRISGDFDGQTSPNIHVVYRSASNEDIEYKKLTVTRNAGNAITSIASGTGVSLDIEATGINKNPSLIVANKGGGVGVEKVAVAYAMNGTSRGEIRFMQRDVAKPNYKDTILATSGLSGYWRLGESSGTNANDESTTANDGTYQATPTLGVAGAIEEDSDTAATFLATSLQYVSALDNNAYDFGTGDFSLEVWVKNDAFPASTPEFILGHNGDGGATDWELYWRATVDGFQSRISGATTCNSGTGADVSDNKWHHIVVTMDRSALCTWYIDGEVSGTPTDISGGSATDLTNTSPLYIGRRNAGNYYDGSLDEVAIYKGVVLTADQVQQHYDAGTYAWRNASEEISGVGACSDSATSGAAGLPNAVTCKGTADKILNVASTTTHHGVLTQIPGKPKRSPASVKKDINGTFTTLTNTIDNNTGTTNDVNSLTTTDYIYVGDDKPFSKVTFDLTDTNNCTGAPPSCFFNTREYWNGASWTSLSNFVDNTYYTASLNNQAFKEDGSILFDEPSDWATTTVDGVSGKYWIRLRPNAVMESTVSIAEVYVNDRNSKALLVVGGVNSTADLGASYVVWDEILNDRWENVPDQNGTGAIPDIGAPWRNGITALDDLGGSWAVYTNFPLSAAVDYKNNAVYVGYVEDTTTDVLHVKYAPNNKDLTIAANWTDTVFPTVTEAADLSLSLTADGSDIYMFYVLDAGATSLVFRRCTGSGGGLGGICDNASDWGSEKTLYEDTTLSHPQAIAAKITGDTVAIDALITDTTDLDVLYTRIYVDLVDRSVLVSGSTDDALNRDCSSGTDDQVTTSGQPGFGSVPSNASCDGSVGSQSHIGIRFQNITVAQGTQISSAYIDLLTTARVGTDNGPIEFTIYGEDVDNSSVFSDLTDCTPSSTCTGIVSERTRTTSSYSDSIDFKGADSGNSGLWYRLDVTEIVQEIVCRGASNTQPCVGDFNGSGTWASGNALTILMITTEAIGGVQNTVGFNSQDATITDSEPKLQINVVSSGTVGKNYSLGSAVQLATGSASLAVADLDHPFSSVEFGAVASDDTNYASVSATTNYASQSAQPAFMFKVNNSNNDNTYKIDAQVIVKSTVPTTSKPVYLQVYRGGATDNWVTMASNNNTAADNDITLTSSTIDTNTSEYYFNETPGIGTRYAECTTSTANCWTYWRVYQDNPTTTFNDVLSVDYVNIVLAANGPDKVAFSNAARTLTAAACNGAASVFTMELQNGTTPANPTATTVVRVTSNSSSYTIYSDDTCTTAVTNGDFTYTTSQNTKSVYIIDNKKSITTRTLTGTRQSGDTLTTGTQNYTVNAGAVSKLVVTLPGQTFTDGTGNSGTVTNQASGIRFPIQINATDANFNLNTSYTGDKILVFSGPGVGTSTPTVLDKNNAAVNYGTNTTITFSSGTAASVGTTLYKGETITITATDGGSYGNASASLTIDVSNTKIRGGTTIRGGSKIQ